MNSVRVVAHLMDREPGSNPNYSIGPQSALLMFMLTIGLPTMFKFFEIWGDERTTPTQSQTWRTSTEEPDSLTITAKGSNALAAQIPPGCAPFSMESDPAMQANHIDSIVSRASGLDHAARHGVVTSNAGSAEMLRGQAPCRRTIRTHSTTTQGTQK